MLQDHRISGMFENKGQLTSNQNVNAGRRGSFWGKGSHGSGRGFSQPRAHAAADVSSGIPSLTPTQWSNLANFIEVRKFVPTTNFLVTLENSFYIGLIVILI